MTDRGNKKLNEVIEKYINNWHGTPTGIMVSKMYYGASDYVEICKVIGIEYDEYL